jgi:uncharacterized membrane protein YoaK (UPF0700 family)
MPAPNDGHPNGSVMPRNISVKIWIALLLTFISGQVEAVGF